MSVLIDTSVLIGQRPLGEAAAISVLSLAELHFGAHAPVSSEARQIRLRRLGEIEALFSPLPVDASVAREWGRLSAAVAVRGGQPRRRMMDLGIAATANVHGLPLVTLDDDLEIVRDLVDLRSLA